MRIEEITEESVRKERARGLRNLRARFIQVWKSRFAGRGATAWGSAEDRELFLKRYRVLVGEISRRQLCFKNTNEIDLYLLRKKLYGGVDPASLPEKVLLEDCVTIAGAFIYDPHKAPSLDLHIAKCLGLEEEENSALVGMVAGMTGKEVVHKNGPPPKTGALFMPLYDLVLRPKDEPVRKEATAVRTEKYIENMWGPYGDYRIYPSTWEHSFIMEGSVRESYDQFHTSRRTDNKKPYEVVWGVKDELWTEHAWLYSKNVWTEEDARKHSSTKEGTFSAALPLPEDANEVGVVVGKSAPPEKVPIIKFALFKVDKAEQIVGGIVYEPMVVDSQGDFATENEIREAMYGFMEKSQSIHLMHGDYSTRSRVLESYQVPMDFGVELPDGSVQEVKKGTWWLTVRVRNPEIWDAIEKGIITGFSMGGYSGQRETEITV